MSSVQSYPGITQAEYDILFKRQKGRCAICHSNDVRRLVVDHDHRTGRVRGLLCDNCNYYTLPPFEHFDAVMAYLRKRQGVLYRSLPAGQRHRCWYKSKRERVLDDKKKKDLLGDKDKAKVRS